MSSTNKQPGGGNPVPPKRARGRPRRNRNVYVHAVRRTEIDYYKLVRTLFGLIDAKPNEATREESEQPQQGKDTGEKAGEVP